MRIYTTLYTDINLIINTITRIIHLSFAILYNEYNYAKSTSLLSSKIFLSRPRYYLMIQ